MKKIKITFIISWVVVSIIGISLNAQNHEQVFASAPFSWKDHFADQYAKAGFAFSFSGTTQKDFLSWQKAFLPQLKEKLGLTKLEAMYPGFVPKAEKRSSEDMGEFVREKWYIWTEPDVPLPVVILIPKNKTGKLPLVITPHGHSKNTEMYAGIASNEEETKMMVEGERDVAVQAVKEGYIAIAPTTRGFGETRIEDELKSDKLSSCRNLLLHDLMTGRTPIGDRVWDMSRLIDWALKNLPVDPKRIAMTGNSGGGTVTLFAAACDTRIAVAVPGCYFCTFKGSIMAINHCECNYIPGILGLGEMYDVAGLIAPRPFCSISGRIDDIFPITETQFAFEKLKKIYAAAGVPGNCELFIGEGGHRYYKAGSWPFIKKHFEQIK